MPSIVGYEGNKNSPWYPLFGDSILRHRVIIKVGINFKSKNPIVVLHFHKIQLRLNVSRIYIAKIRERGIRRKHLLFVKKIIKKKKKGYATDPWIYKIGLFEEVGHEISIVN